MALRSLFSGISGLQTHQLRLDVISNNIANVNTTAFKASRVRFEDVLSQTTEIATAPDASRGGQNPVQIGLGVTGAAITRDMRQGSVELTGRLTDLAIQGNGFFVVRDGETVAEFYTRDGSFEVDADGNLVKASNGFRVQGWNSVFDTVAQQFAIDTSQPIEDIEVDLFQQFPATATTSITLSGNLDNRAPTAIDPITVEWTKNGLTREVEVRFIHVDPARNLFLWRLFDPNRIDSNTGDATLITTDQAGVEASGIIQLDSNGRVIRHFINTADDDAADPATTYLNLASTTEAPSAPDIWAVARPGSTFNGFDFVVLDTEGDGNNFVTENNSRLSSVTTDTTANTITITAPNAPFSSQANLTGTAFPDGFATDGVFQTGTPNAGIPGTPGSSLGVPVQFIQSRSSVVATKRVNVAGNTLVQLPADLIVGENRANPTRSGELANGPNDPSVTTTGTDTNTIQVFIDGRQYTRVANSGAFTPGSAQFALDAVNGIIEINGTIPAGVNIIVNYDHEIRPTNTWTTTAATTVGALAGNIVNITSGAAGAATRTAPDGTVVAGFDSSVFWRPGLGGTITIAGEAFTEVPYQRVDAAGTNLVAADLAPNTYAVNPETGAIIFGNLTATGLPPAAGDVISPGWTFETYRRTRDNTGAGAAIAGLNNLDAQEGATTNNAHGFNDMWRLLSLPTNGAETGQGRLYLQGDGAGVPPTAATLTFLPAITGTTFPRRAELNYESDDRVNLIIPNGLTKTPNVNPLVDLTPETFAFAPNINQVTGNNGNNNQADSGDSVAATVRPRGDFQYTTAIQVFDSLGQAHNLSLRFERIDRNLWVVSAIDPTDPAGARIAGYRLIAFDADGAFDTANTIPFQSPAAQGTSSSTFTGFYFDPPQEGGAPPPAEGAKPLLITPDFTKLVQRAAASNAVVSDQNGSPPGNLESFSFNNEGFLVALFDNGRTRNLARIALQNFVNPAGLVSVGGNLFRETLNSGKIGAPGAPGTAGLGSIIPGALEASNVDLSVEFVDLIITQRGFQAQSRSITTADQVLQEILTLKR